MNARFPLTPGFVTGIPLIGFFDGIVFHQILQWHHMICIETHCAVKTVANLRRQTFADGLFHLVMWLVLLAALVLLTRALRTTPFEATRFWGATLLGAGVFQVVEGIVDHHLLQIHHVRFGPGQTTWDVAFLLSGVAMIAAGRWVSGRSAA